MDISDIELIQVITTTGSLSRASESLHLSQPTLSKRLTFIEEQLKTKLFHRHPKGMAPTAIAKIILTKAKPLRARLAEIERQVELMIQLEDGQLTLGVGPIIEQILLPQVLMRFIETTGGAQISVVTDGDQTLLEMFDSSELDVIVGPFNAGQWGDREIVSIPMIKDEIVAIARQKHPIFKEKIITEHDLTQYPWVAPKAQGTVQQPVSKRYEKALKVVSDNYDLLKKITLNTDSICAGPRSVFTNEIESMQLREIEYPLRTKWVSALLVKPDTLLTPLAARIISLFEAAAHNK